MSASLPQQVRVLVKGASTAVMISWMGGPRTDLAYPRVLEADLLAAGRPAQVRVTAAVGQRARDALKNWEREVVTWSPDVVVLHYGQYEAIHLFIPWRLERYVNNVARLPGARRDWVHTNVVRKAYITLGVAQKHLDRKLDQRLRRPLGAGRIQRMAADMERLVSRVRNIASPLVLIPDQLHPGPNWAKAFPGMAARVDLMNSTLDELVERIGDPDVRRFSINDVVAGLGVDEDLTPDGGHFSPLLHREVGHAVARVVMEWAATQPHLRAGLPDRPDLSDLPDCGDAAMEHDEQKTVWSVS